MSKDLTAATFDYSTVEKDTKGKLLCIAREIAQAKKQHTASGMVIGEAIAQAHSLLAGDGRDGAFANWIEAECGFSRSTAYNYMNAWQRFGKCPTVGHFDSAALYALASPQAPEKAVKEAEKLADKGVKITLDRAKALLDKFREVSDRPKDSGRTSAPKKPPSQSDAPPTPAEDEPPAEPEEVDVDQTFADCLEYMRLSLKCMEELKTAAPTKGKRFETAYESMDLAHQEVKAWQREARKGKQ